MIVFTGEGRLGNQLFQYAFLKTIQNKSERIVVFGFDELKSVFNIDDFITISQNNRLRRLFARKIMKPIFSLLAEYRIISSIKVKKSTEINDYMRESTEYSHFFGLIKNITYIKGGTFHSEKFFDSSSINSLTLRKTHIEKAQKSLLAIPESAHKVFIHIRRGDYKEYYVYGKPTLLPIEYFKRQIEWFERNVPKSYFVFLSDDPASIKFEFTNVNNKMIIERSSMGTDFAIMTLCKSGILSPSSFGWWGSYMMKNRNTVIAPKYWLGFNSNHEYPESPYPSYATLADSNDLR